MRLSRLEYERPGRRRVQRRTDQDLKCEPMQVGLSLAFHGEGVLQMFSAYHILIHSIVIWPKAKYNK